MKKLLPWLLFLAAAILLYWIKTNQRGGSNNGGNQSTEISSRLDRNQKNISYSKHARCRMDCREIDESEVLDILNRGTINYNRVEEDEQGVTIPLEGVTNDGQKVRIVFAPKKNKTVVVTAIDLNKDWPCNCP